MLSKNRKHTVSLGSVTVTFTIPSCPTLAAEATAIDNIVDHASREIGIAKAAGFVPVSATATELGCWVTCVDTLAAGGVA